MLEQITWGTYLGAAAMITGGYYLITGGLFYRKEIRAVAHKKFRQDDQNPVDDEGEAEAFEELEAVVLDLKNSVLEKAGIGIGKEDLLQRLKVRLMSYDGLRRPAYQSAVNDFILLHAKEICGVAFVEDELDEAWKTLPRN